VGLTLTGKGRWSDLTLVDQQLELGVPHSLLSLIIKKISYTCFLFFFIFFLLFMASGVNFKSSP
jgi:hypothetical protein